MRIAILVESDIAKTNVADQDRKQRKQWCYDLSQQQRNTDERFLQLGDHV